MQMRIVSRDEVPSSSGLPLPLERTSAGTRVGPLPVQTVTLLFSDLEGSTRLLQSLGSGYAALLLELREMTRTAVASELGVEIDTAGDGFFAAFPTARGAVAAAARLQRIIAEHSWPAPVRIRIGIHTGEPAIADDTYVGLDVHRTARICSAAGGGQVLVSEATRNLVLRDLPEGAHLVDLGSHHLKDLEAPEHLFQLVVDEMTFSGGIRSATEMPGSLPAQLTSFIGREQELATATDMVRQYRLVTLTGPGGTGKTRLSIAAAAAVQTDFRDGVAFVGLASTRDAVTDLDLLAVSCCIRSCGETCEIVSRAIAHALGVNENPLRPIFDSVKDHLRHRQILLLLDNFEQFLDAAPLVSEMLASSPDLHVLVTSRIPLHVSAEREYRVPPLSLPSQREDRGARSLARHGAVALFAERARAVKADFALTDDNAADVAEICVRLDGLPLAIELAAARTKVLPPAAILRRLSDRLRLLTGGGKDLPERHQTLRQAIAWSYELLNKEEQACFRRLSAFLGGFTLEAAEFVCSEIGEFSADALDTVSALVDKSLLRQEEGIGGEPRFVMLETIRDFGQECLVSANEVDVVYRAHARFFLNLAEEAEPHLTGRGQHEWLDRLEADYDNLRTALAWAEEHDDAEVGLGICAAMWRFWLIRGHLSEVRERLEKVLALASAQAPAKSRARVLNGLGTIIHEIGDFNAARHPLEESLQIWRTLGDKAGTASVLNNLSWIAAMLGDNDASVSMAEESLLIHRELGNKRGIAVALHNMSFVALQQSRIADARGLLHESMQLRQAIGDIRGVSYEQTMLAWVEMFDGNNEKARELVDTALRVLTQMSDRQLVPWAYHVKGRVAFEQGHYEEARDLIEKSLELWRNVGNRNALADAMADLACALCKTGELQRARSLAEESLSLIAPAGSPWFTSSALIALAGAERSCGNRERALALYEECLQIKRRLGDQRGTAACLEGISGCRSEP